MNLYNPLTAQILICLVTAHVLGDFMLQTSRDARTKRQWTTLLKHTVIHAGLAYLLAGLWTNWLLPLAVFISHTVIDAIKSRLEEPGPRAFLLDQAAHLVALAALAAWCARDPVTLYWVDLADEWYLKASLLLTGAILTIYAGGFLIGLAVKPFLEALQAANSTNDSSLPATSRGFANGGQVIGRLERALILIFVLTHNPGGVGFLFAAKSILRFGEVKDPAHRMEAEYIIIGTLMSFGYGILVATLTQALLAVSWVP
jgi:hypothetical protein